MWIILPIGLIISIGYILSRYRTLNPEQKESLKLILKKNRKIVYIIAGIWLSVFLSVPFFAKKNRTESQEMVTIELNLTKDQHDHLKRNAIAQVTTVEKLIVKKIFGASALDKLTGTAKMFGQSISSDLKDSSKVGEEPK